jgi:amino acid transporter
MESDFLEDYPDAFAALIIVILAILMCYGVEEVALVNKVFTAVNIGVIIFVAISGFVKADIQNWKQTEQDVRDKLLFESTNGTAKVQCRDINQYNVDNYLAYGTLIGNLTEYPKTLDTRDSDGNVTAVVTPNVSDVDDSPDFCDNECWKEKQETGGYPGKGGFLPYGFSGVIAGTATCFYAFVGFDAIATTGEEAINPQRNIPISIVLSLIVCCVAYLGISASLTLMVPYYLLDKQAPLPAAFSYVGIEWASYVVGIGATCALTTSLLGAMFPMPRVIYAMAEDGILYRKLAEVHAKTQTPIVATVVSGTLAAVLALIFDLKELVDFMSIGTLMAYTLVAASVMILRYRASDDDVQEPISDSPLGLQDFYKPRSNSPNEISTKVVTINSTILTLACIAFSAVGVTEEQHGFNNVAWAILGISAFVILMCTLSIRAQPESSSVLDFKVPMIPFIPVVNILVNVYLMVALPWSIWLKLLVWLGAGYFIYFTYGMHHSTEADKNSNTSIKLGLVSRRSVFS